MLSLTQRVGLRLYTINDFQVFLHADAITRQVPYQTCSTSNYEALVTEFQKANCNATGFRVCSHLSGPERMKAYLGLFIICNGRSVALAKQISNSRSSHVLKMITALVEVWDVELELIDGVIQLSSLGPFLNEDPTQAVRYAFPKGQVLHRKTLYQLL